MPDIPLLDLATTWAEAASERPEVMLLRLCDWAVLEGFPPASFIDRTGAPVDVFAMWVSARAIITAGAPIAGSWAFPADPCEAFQHLREIYVTLTGLSAFCRQTSILCQRRSEDASADRSKNASRRAGSWSTAF